jgi:hypothetical protein
MPQNDIDLIAEAYISMKKKMVEVPSDEETVTTEPNEIVSAGPVDEPAPGVDMDMDDEEHDHEHDTTGVPVAMGIVGHPEAGMSGDSRFSVEDENEEDNMTIDNLFSIKESLMKIVMYASSGGHLEPWQSQKVAIAMDNLGEVARRLRKGC